MYFQGERGHSQIFLEDLVVANTILSHPLQVKAVMVDTASENMAMSPVFGALLPVTNEITTYDEETPAHLEWKNPAVFTGGNLVQEELLVHGEQLWCEVEIE